MAARELAGALRLVRGRGEWAPPVVTCSALDRRRRRRGLGRGSWPTASTSASDGLAAQARRPAARLHLGAGPRRARPAAAPLAGRGGDPRRGAREPCSPVSCRRRWPPTGSSRRTTPEHCPERAAGSTTLGRSCPRSLSRPPSSSSPTVVDKYADELIDLRRDLHAHPELSWTESRTTELVVDRARPTPAGGVTPLAGRRPDRRARHAASGGVALRADLDALPVEDLHHDPWASTVPGVAHACGHDVHTAGLVGAGAGPRRGPRARRCCPAGCGCSSSRPRRSCPAAPCT